MLCPNGMFECVTFSFCLWHLYELLTDFKICCQYSVILSTTKKNTWVVILHRTLFFPLYMNICYRNILLNKYNIKVTSDQWKYIICTIDFCEQAYTATAGSVKGSTLAT